MRPVHPHSCSSAQHLRNLRVGVALAPDGAVEALVVRSVCGGQREPLRRRRGGRGQDTATGPAPPCPYSSLMGSAKYSIAREVEQVLHAGAGAGAGAGVKRTKESEAEARASCRCGWPLAARAEYGWCCRRE